MVLPGRLRLLVVLPSAYHFYGGAAFKLGGALGMRVGGLASRDPYLDASWPPQGDSESPLRLRTAIVWISGGFRLVVLFVLTVVALASRGMHAVERRQC